MAAHNDLTSTGGDAVSHHAVSNETSLASTDAEVSFVVADEISYGRIYLVAEDAEPTTFSEVPYVLHPRRISDDIKLYVYQSGTTVHSASECEYGDTVSIHRNGATGTVTYRKNGSTFYTGTTSTIAMDAGAYPDDGMVMQAIKMAIDGAAAVPATWRYLLNCTQAESYKYSEGSAPIHYGISSLSTGASWSRNAGSAEDIPADTDGKASFIFHEGTSRVMFGFIAQNEAITSYTGVNFGVYCDDSTNNISIYEEGSGKGTKGVSLVHLDVIEVRRDGTTGTVTYYQNGTLIYTSLTTSTVALSVGVSLRDKYDAIFTPKLSVDGGAFEPVTWDYFVNSQDFEDHSEAERVFAVFTEAVSFSVAAAATFLTSTTQVVAFALGGTLSLLRSISKTLSMGSAASVSASGAVASPPPAVVAHNDLTAGASLGYGATTETIPANTDGELSALAGDERLYARIGFIAEDLEHSSSSDLSFAIVIDPSQGRFILSESGTNKLTSEYRYGDVASIHRDGSTGTVTYKQNGTVIYTSLSTSTVALDGAAIITANHQAKVIEMSIDGGAFAPVTWRYLSDCTQAASYQYSSGAAPIYSGVQSNVSTSWGAGAGASVDIPADTDGKCSFIYRESYAGRVMMGLMDLNRAISSYTQLDYGIYGNDATDEFSVYEGGTLKASYSAVHGDLFEIRRDGTTGTVTYHLNGALKYTSLTTTTIVQSVGVALRSKFDAIFSPRISVGGGAFEPIVWDFLSDVVLFDDHTQATVALSVTETAVNFAITTTTTIATALGRVLVFALGGTLSLLRSISKTLSMGSAASVSASRAYEIARTMTSTATFSAVSIISIIIAFASSVAHTASRGFARALSFGVAQSASAMRQLGLSVTTSTATSMAAQTTRAIGASVVFAASTVFSATALAATNVAVAFAAGMSMVASYRQSATNAAVAFAIGSTLAAEWVRAMIVSFASGAAMSASRAVGLVSVFTHGSAMSVSRSYTKLTTFALSVTTTILRTFTSSVTVALSSTFTTAESAIERLVERGTRAVAMVGRVLLQARARLGNRDDQQ